MRTIFEYPEVNPFNDNTSGRVICWMSGGVASAVACYLTLKKYGKERCQFVFCDTSWEHPDTYRFFKDYENTLGVTIHFIKSDRMSNPPEVWRRYKGMSFASGAPCSTVLKKEPRLKFQKIYTDFCQVFGFDFDAKEMRRAENMLVNNPEINPIFPLIVEQLDRKKIFKKLQELGIQPPETYKFFNNNNCIGSPDSEDGGCVRGGVGYWKHIRKVFPKKFEKMAKLEHEISALKGAPVTICKDQRKGKRGNRLFLKFNPAYPDIETIDVIKGRHVVSLPECNGFCATTDDSDT